MSSILNFHHIINKKEEKKRSEERKRAVIQWQWPSDQKRSLQSTQKDSSANPRAEQGQVGWALGNMIWWLATLPVSRGLEFDDPCGSFQSRLSYESVDMSMYQCWDLGTSSSVKHTL